MHTLRAALILVIHISLWTFAHSSTGTICQSRINIQKNVCYWLETSTSSFVGAQQRCASKGGNLATVNSVGTSEFIKDFLNTIGLADATLWIGYDERNKRWEDGTPFAWSNYQTGEPGQQAEYCTAMSVKMESTWFDLPCSKTRKSLCQSSLISSGQFRFIGVNEGSTVSVGDRVVVVQTASRVSCGLQCVRDAACSVYRYTKDDKTCTLYNSGTIIKTVTNHGEWYVYQ